MRVFMALLKLNIKTLIQYKASFLISMIGDPVILLINIANFTAIYAYNKSAYILGYNLSQMIWYFAGITLIWYLIWNSTDNNISTKIISGDLSVTLLKPVSLFLFEFANALSLRLVALFLEFLPSIILYSIFFFPEFLTLNSLLKFLLTAVLSFILYFLINYLIGLSAFNIKSNYSLQSIKIVLISLTAGAFIPLDFFPLWVRTIAGLLPFQYLFYWPLQIFLNKDIVKGILPFLKIIGFQLFWIISLFILCRLLWKLVLKRYCAAGG